jgi:hypothetical protein
MVINCKEGAQTSQIEASKMTEKIKDSVGLDAIIYHFVGIRTYYTL